MFEVEHERRIQTWCLLTLTAIAVGATLYWLAGVLIPFVLAIFLSLTLAPVIDLLIRRLHLPRVVAIVGTFFLGIVAVGGLATLVTASFSDMSANSGLYQARLDELLVMVRDKIPFERFGWTMEEKLAELEQELSDSIGGTLKVAMGAVMGVLSDAVLVLLFLLFLLIGKASFARHTTGIWGQVESSVRGYVLTKVVTSSVTGFITYAVLQFLGVELALVFGLFAFLLNFIPNVGSFVAVLLPLPIVLLSPELTTTEAILALAIPGAVQFTVGNLLEPKMMGTSLDLHPVTIMIALIFWGTLWGVVGMLLAAPITAVVKICLGKMEVTAPLAEVLAGRISTGSGETA